MVEAHSQHPEIQCMGWKFRWQNWTFFYW